MGRAHTDQILRTDRLSPYPSLSGEILLKAGNTLFCIVAPAVASVLSTFLGVGGKLFIWPSGVEWDGRDRILGQGQAGACQEQKN